MQLLKIKTKMKSKDIYYSLRLCYGK